MYHVSSSKNTRKKDKISSELFFESIPYDKINPEKIRKNNYQFNNIQKIENKLTRFHFYPETELACKYNAPLYKTQYAEFLVQYKKRF